MFNACGRPRPTVLCRARIMRRHRVAHYPEFDCCSSSASLVRCKRWRQNNPIFCQESCSHAEKFQRVLSTVESLFYAHLLSRSRTRMGDLNQELFSVELRILLGFGDNFEPVARPSVAFLALIEFLLRHDIFFSAVYKFLKWVYQSLSYSTGVWLQDGISGGLLKLGESTWQAMETRENDLA